MSALLVLTLLGCTALAQDLAVSVSEHEIKLQAGDRTYTIGDDGNIRPLGMRPNIAGADATGKGIWLFPAKMTLASVVTDEADRKVVAATWELTEGAPKYQLELELEINAGSPALTVVSRVRRVEEGGGGCYYFWGFTRAVTQYTTPLHPARSFAPTQWDVRPRARWMLIADPKAGIGYGVISDGRIGRAPASGEGIADGEVPGFPYLLCTPRTLYLREGQSLDVGFTVFDTLSAVEVQEVYRSSHSAQATRPYFDGRHWDAALQDPGQRIPAHDLRTEDGLAVSLTSDGRVAGLTLGAGARPGGDKSLLPLTDFPISGLLLRDFRAGGAPEPVGGTVTRIGDGSLHQRALVRGIQVTADYRALPDRISISVQLHDTTGEDRAVTAYFALPVRNDRGWAWGDSTEASRSTRNPDEYISAAAQTGYPAGANGTNSQYPFASLSGPAELGLAVPLDEPRQCRLVYNSETAQFYAAFDLALTSETKQFPSSAGLSLSVFTFETGWGFRGCADKYYRMFPQFFEKRVKRDGGWVCWGNCADVPDIGELGYAYHWGLSGPEACKWDNDHGIYAFPYIEATNMHQTMEEYETATSEDVIKRLEWIADPARTEPIPQWKYDHPYGAHLGDRDEVLRRSATAYLKSLIYDPAGHIYGSVNTGEWGFLVAKYIPCNANPAIPGGVGDFFLNFWLPRTQEHMESTGGKIDGIAMDNFHVGDTALGRRREQFAYSTIPLTFDTATGEPVILKNFTTYEWTREAAQRLRPQGKFIIANTCSAQFPFTYHLLDIHGYEWNIEGLAPFARVLAYHKPVCTLPVQDRHKEESWIKWHLRYGFMPGGYANYQTMLNRDAMKKYAPIARALQAAGWEPIPAARSRNRFIGVERFGDPGRGSVYLTVFNRSDDPLSTYVTVNLERLGVSENAKLLEMTTGESTALDGDRLKVSLAPRDVQVFWLQE